MKLLDLPTKLARKWCLHGQKMDGKIMACQCDRIAAAIREALEEATQVAHAVGTQAAATDQGARWPTIATCGAIVAAGEIADRLRALK